MKDMENSVVRKRVRQAGFTLIELMVVVAIIAILATTAGVYLLGATEDAEIAKAQSEIKALESAVIAYRLKNRKLPDSLEQVAEFMRPQRIPMDPWGNNYVYTKEGPRKFKIVSYGPEGTPGSASALSIDAF